MSEVGVRELKTHLSEYLRRVKAGETVSITEHGRTIGRMVPESRNLAQRIEDMQRAGLLAWSGHRLRDIEPVAANRGKRQVSDLLVENRK